MDTRERRYVGGLYYAMGWNGAQETYRLMVDPTKFAEFYASEPAEKGTVQDQLATYMDRHATV